MTEERWRWYFGARLRRYMNEFNMSQTELAKKIFVTRGTINAYLSGRVTPSIKALVNLSMVFACDVADLIDVGEDIR